MNATSGPSASCPHFVILGAALMLGLGACADSDRAGAGAATVADTAAPARTAAIAGHGTQTAAGGQSAASMEMHQILGAAKAVPLTMSGDIDNDFASAMSAHHRSAIKIIDILRENGEAPELRALAGRMKAARLTEIEAMAARKDAAPQGKILAKGTRESEGSSELERVMAASMTMPMTMSVSVDRDFASLMTMHHTTALEMIDVLLKYGTSCDMTTLGATMKATHQDELTKLNRYVK